MVAPFGLMRRISPRRLVVQESRPRVRARARAQEPTGRGLLAVVGGLASVLLDGVGDLGGEADGLGFVEEGGDSEESDADSVDVGLGVTLTVVRVRLIWPSGGSWGVVAGGVEPGCGGFCWSAVAGVGAVEEGESGFLGCAAGVCAAVGLEGREGGERVVAAVAVARFLGGPLGVAATTGVDLRHGVSGRGFGLAVSACTVEAGREFSPWG